jgi:hypothetical protein
MYGLREGSDGLIKGATTFVNIAHREAVPGRSSGISQMRQGCIEGFWVKLLGPRGKTLTYHNVIKVSALVIISK